MQVCERRANCAQTALANVDASPLHTKIRDKNAMVECTIQREFLRTFIGEAVRRIELLDARWRQDVVRSCQVKRRIAEVHVAPIDYSGQTSVIVYQDMARIQVAVNDTPGAFAILRGDALEKPHQRFGIIWSDILVEV